MKFNLTLEDSTYLHEVILSTTKDNYTLGELRTIEEFNIYLATWEHKIIYFCGKYVQGGISSPKIIKDYEVIEE